MYIAVMGYGVVGSGVVKVLQMNRDHISRKSRHGTIDVKYILDIKEINDENAHLVTKDFNDILNDSEVHVVVETMGGLHPAFEFVSACLKAGKSVVTSNKELVAEKGLELLTLARANQVNFVFEASVAGGIPVIRPISGSLNGNEIQEVAGIINGTTNFILTKMIDENMDYNTALKLAQENGYAEKDPTADVEGIDACRKICILSALAFGKHVYPGQVYTQGISKLELKDVEYAGDLGYVIKLLARSKKIGDQISVVVTPALVKKSSMLACVNGVNNAVLVRANAVGEILMYGPGAGMLPTASAVVGDVIDCCNHYMRPKFFGWLEDASEDFVRDYTESETSLFVRLSADSDKAKINELFGNVQFIEKEDIAFLTPVAVEKELREKLAVLGDKVKSVIHVTDF
ncbi:MAG: homoserine dehydrogenase [Clostridia bacterium]|nr:homoserine dehydrogenase [Clostridia bacterium]